MSSVAGGAAMRALLMGGLGLVAGVLVSLGVLLGTGTVWPSLPSRATPTAPLESPAMSTPQQVAGGAVVSPVRDGAGPQEALAALALAGYHALGGKRVAPSVVAAAAQAVKAAQAATPAPFDPWTDAAEPFPFLKDLPPIPKKVHLTWK